MKRFYSEKIEDEMVVTGDDHNHLAFATRSTIGDDVTFCNGDGFDYNFKITKITKKETYLKLFNKTKNDSEPSINVTLFSAILKGDKLDLVVQKAVELGAIKVVPIVTKFVQTPASFVKTERLNKIASEACKQCGRNKLVAVSEPIPFSEMLKNIVDFDLVVFPYEEENCLDIKSFLAGRSGDNVALIIGSEGGFSVDEVKLLADKGVKSVSLGKRILRGETANIATLSIVMYELNQLK